VTDGNGVRWQKEVPLPGMNSPVVWEDRVFLSGANANTREVYCYDALSGDLIWKRALVQPTDTAQESVEVSEHTGYAASTMATDGSHAFAIFADGDLAAFDFDGTPLWQISLGLPVNAYGYSSSLASSEDLVIVQFDRKQDSFIAGIEATTGIIRWQTEREFGPFWASPLIIHTAQGPQIITAADPNVIAYDLRTGDELWNVECLKGAEVAVSPSFADGVVYVAAEYISLTAIDVATHQILWQSHDVIPGISTPLVVNGLMFFGLTDSGIVCLDAKTGELLWEAQTDDSIYASPVLVLVNTRVYLVDLGGAVHIFRADGESFLSLGSSKIGEEAFSTPAIAGDGLFIRGVKHLFRFGS
jgi:outer membrane protein assembly factor BamB